MVVYSITSPSFARTWAKFSISALYSISLSFFHANIMGELLLLAAEQVKRMSFPRTATVVSGWRMICGLGKSAKRKQQAVSSGLQGKTGASREMQ